MSKKTHVCVCVNLAFRILNCNKKTGQLTQISISKSSHVKKHNTSEERVQNKPFCLSCQGHVANRGAAEYRVTRLPRVHEILRTMFLVLEYSVRNANLTLISNF